MDQLKKSQLGLSELKHVYAQERELIEKKLRKS